MKKLILTILSFLLGISLMAQTPNLVSYQAVVRDASNNVISNAAVGMEVNILLVSENETSVVYSETHTPTTNVNGLVSIKIGEGNNPSSVFADIDWGSSNGTYNIETKIDPAGGTNYTITGSSQLLSVPYALHAKTAEEANEFDLEQDLRIGYQKKIYSRTTDEFKFEMYPFTINGDTEFRNYYATGNYKFFVSNGTHGNADTYGLVIKETGDVGIGTDTPKAKLHIKNSNNTYGAILANANENAFSLYTKTLNTNLDSESFRLGLKYNDNENNGFISFYRGKNDRDGFLGFSTSGIERLRIDKTGRANFAGKVEVNNNLLINNGTLKFSKDGVSNVYFSLSGGNATYLHLHGDGLIAGTNNTQNLGLPDWKFKNLYLGNNAYIDNKLVVNTARFDDKVGIGIENTEEDVMLLVDGRVDARSHTTDIASGADYVFADDYDLMTLSEVESYIDEHSHLPEIASAETMENEGLDLGEMSISLLKKIEELTLYTIEQEKEIKKLKDENKKLEELSNQLLQIQEDIKALKNQ